MFYQIATICCTFILLFNTLGHCAPPPSEFGEGVKKKAQESLREIKIAISEINNVFNVDEYKIMAKNFATGRSGISLIKERAKYLEIRYQESAFPSECKGHMLLREKPSLSEMGILHRQLGALDNEFDYRVHQGYGRNLYVSKSIFLEHAWKEFQYIYKELENKFTKKYSKLKPNVVAYSMLAKHDLVSNVTEKVRDYLEVLLDNLEHSELEVWQRKRFAIWAMMEQILKPLLTNILNGVKVENPVYNMESTVARVGKNLEIPQGWVDAEAKLPNSEQKQIRLNAVKLLLVYEQLSKGKNMFPFGTEEEIAKGKKLASDLRHNTLPWNSKFKLLKVPKLERLPLAFGEVIYDSIAEKMRADKKWDKLREE